MHSKEQPHQTSHRNMYSRTTNIAPARRNSNFGNTSSFIRRSSLNSVAEDDGHDDEPQYPAQEMLEMRAMNGSGHGHERRDSITSSTSSSMISTQSGGKSKSKSKRRDSLASWASGRRRRNKSSSSSKIHRRNSLESSTSSWASEQSSVVSMSEGNMDTVGWASRRNTFAARRGSFFRKRRLASELLEQPSEESGSIHLADLSTLTLSEDGEQIQKRSTSITSTASTDRSYSETTALTLEDGDGGTDHSTAAEQQPRRPRPSRPSQRAMMRYMPARPTQARIDELFAHERSSFDAVKMQWQAYEEQMEMQQYATYSGHRRSKRGGAWSNSSGGDANVARLADEQYLHFVRAASYDVGAALTLLHDCNCRVIGLTCAGMETQLRTKTLFAVPGLQSREGFDVFYMRPSRYFPKQTKTSVVIDNLLYVMKALVERERSSTEGIAFMANMAGWEMTNFSMNYCLQFMKALQGENFPVEVRRFLIIDPPSWFDSESIDLETYLAMSILIFLDAMKPTISNLVPFF